MDAIKSALGGGGGSSNTNQQQTTHQPTTEQTQQQGGGGFMSGLMNKANAAAGGGPESEKKEDYLDKGKTNSTTYQPILFFNSMYSTYPFFLKPSSLIVMTSGIDFAQEKFMGAGPQNNESAIEQAKDEQISDFIRGQYKSNVGKDFPVQDK